MGGDLQGCESRGCAPNPVVSAVCIKDVQCLPGCDVSVDAHLMLIREGASEPLSIFGSALISKCI